MRALALASTAALLLLTSGFAAASSDGRLRSESTMRVGTNAGQSTETPMEAFASRSS